MYFGANDFGHFLISMLWIFLLVMFFIILFQIIIDLFSDHELSGWAKAFWLIFLILFPPLTALIYLIARGNSMAKRRQAQFQAAKSAQDAYIKQVASASSGPADQIASAKALLDAGTISQAEFDQLKAKALS